MKKKNGKALEQLIKILETDLADSCATVESSKRLRDAVTGKFREHDILITLRNGHHHVLIALECRDRSRRVGVPDVEAFLKKCEHTLVNQGIIVSAAGFAQTALKKAAACGLRCLTLDTAPTFSWLPDAFVRSVHQKLWALELKINLETPLTSLEVEDFEIVDDFGRQIPRAAFEQHFLDEVGSQEWCRDRPRGDFCVALSIEIKPRCFVLERRTRNRFPIKSVLGRGHFHLSVEEMPLSLRHYRDQSNGDLLSQVALGKTTMGEAENTIVFVKDPSAGGSVWLTVGDSDEIIKAKIVDATHRS